MSAADDVEDVNGSSDEDDEVDDDEEDDEKDDDDDIDDVPRRRDDDDGGKSEYEMLRERNMARNEERGTSTGAGTVIRPNRRRLRSGEKGGCEGGGGEEEAKEGRKPGVDGVSVLSSAH